MMAAMTFIDFVLEMPDLSPGLAGTLLYAAKQFILLAIEELQFVIRQACEFLFQFPLGDVPSSFGCKLAHRYVWLRWSAA